MYFNISYQNRYDNLKNVIFQLSLYKCYRNIPSSIIEILLIDLHNFTSKKELRCSF